MPKQRGVTIEDIKVGAGSVVTRGDTIRISYDLSLRRGEFIESVPDFKFKVGERRVVVGLENGVEGMRVGVKRTIEVPPHLGYRDTGVPGTIPGNALPVFNVRCSNDKRSNSPLHRTPTRAAVSAAVHFRVRVGAGECQIR